MFGETIDYFILKFLTHKHNLATEVQLDNKVKNSDFSVDQGRAYLKKIQIYFKNQIPLDPGLNYLDIGCGMGRLSIGLGVSGATNVTGIDVNERGIVEAKTIASRMDKGQRPEFITLDIHHLETDRKYDAIFVLGAMEHIHHPGEFLKRLANLLKPEGRAFVSHEPFQSPIGDHMHGFFKVKIPWRGVLFSEKAILRLRRECYRPTDSVERYQDIVGGLNLMSYSEYLKRVHEAGLEFVLHNHNPQLWLYRRFWALRPISAILTKIPKIRDYFIMTAYSIIRLRH
jgi:2-polyprenyl-3-methyl-5-hydroxy-6-metoxy-1,4-benzoquinol methylase